MLKKKKLYSVAKGCGQSRFFYSTFELSRRWLPPGLGRGGEGVRGESARPRQPAAALTVGRCGGAGGCGCGARGRRGGDARLANCRGC